MGLRARTAHVVRDGQEIEILVEQVRSGDYVIAVSYTHLRAHETVLDLVCRLLLEKKKTNTRITHLLMNKLQQSTNR